LVGRVAAALAELGAEDATGAGTPLTVEVLVRRADRKLSTPYGALRVLHEVGGVAAFRQFGSPELIRLGDQTVPSARRLLSSHQL
jgi:hypothetical protein